MKKNRKFDLEVDPTVTVLSDEEKRLIKGSGGDNGLPPKNLIKTHRAPKK